MGNTCAPNKTRDDVLIDVGSREQFEETQPSEKFTQIINTYQAKNEKMKKELETMRIQDEEEMKKRNAHAQQHDELVKELATLKETLEVKDRALVKHQLETALYSKATSMVGRNALSKLIKTGNIEKFKKAGKSKKGLKWVELYKHGAVVTKTGMTRGYLMLTYTDTKDSQLANRCQVTRINKESNASTKLKGRTFSIDVMVSGKENELAFACEDEKETESWVQAFVDGFREIEEEINMLTSLKSKTYLKVVFSKEKLGIRVEENPLELEVEAEDEKSAGKNQGESGQTEVEVVEDGMEKPCELVVKHIHDDDLHSTGLTIDCIVSAINGTSLRGLSYNKQLDYLSSTKKPYTLTFLKEKADVQAGFPRILEELVAIGDNTVKSAFYDLVKGSEFGRELEESVDKTATIAELLSNQQRLTALLYNNRIQESDL